MATNNNEPVWELRRLVSTAMIMAFDALRAGDQDGAKLTEIANLLSEMEHRLKAMTRGLILPMKSEKRLAEQTQSATVKTN